MQIAIVEDDDFNAKELEKHIQHFSSENNVDIHYTRFPSGSEFVKSYTPIWDLILMDIEMPHINGIETARQIRKIDSEVLIIFITQMAQYAIEGYSVNALDYVLKPVNYYAFSLKLKHVLQLLASRQTDTIIISNQAGKFRIALNTLCYVEVINHTLYYHTLSECITATGSPSLGKLTESLAGKGFARSHQGYLVNLHYVTHYDKTSICVGDDSIPLSRTYYKNFVQQLLAYCGG